jgi:excisionase family DNA binding protein
VPSDFLLALLDQQQSPAKKPDLPLGLDRSLTVQEAAQLVGRSPSTVKQWLWSHRMEFCQDSGLDSVSSAVYVDASSTPE